jgi:hypothetical protein
MGRRLWRFGLMTLLLSSLALGCTKAAVQHKEPPDPLLVTKKPVEGRPARLESEPAYDPPPSPPPDRELFPFRVQPGDPIPVAAPAAAPSFPGWPLSTNR